MEAIHRVITGHDRPRPCLSHRNLKRLQIYLPQRALLYHRVHTHPPRLLLVGHKVLDGCAHPAALQPVDISGGHLTREVGVLRERLEVAPTERRSVHAYCGG
jgi:hypothetical protein